MKSLVIFLIILFILNSCNRVDNSSDDSSAYIYPGEIWYDTDSVPIEAHACGVMLFDGTYYMYGQDQRLGHMNKTGVCCYSSKDLVNWKYEGTALPTSETPEVYQNTGVLERPKVIYNEKTKKFVMWMHLDAEGYSMAEAGIAVSDSPVGPFKFVKSFRPVNYDYGYNSLSSGANPTTEEDLKVIQKLGEKAKGNSFRDMTLFVDDDEKGYVIYSSENNKSLYVVRLSDDYLNIDEPLIEGLNWSRAIVNEKREAPAIFKYKGKYLIISSGLTGWSPNPAMVHIADSILGPWTAMGNPCEGPDAEFTFGSQSTFVLPVSGKNDGSFIFMADIWDGNQLENSTLFWQPFVMRDDFSFSIFNFDRWNMDIFNKSYAMPGIPQILESGSGERKILSWNAENEAAAYRIFRNGKQIGVTTLNEFVLPESLAGTEYECSVDAITLKGISSGKSDVINVKWEEAYDCLLSNFTPDSWKQGFSSLQINKSINGSPLRMKDKEFTDGFGVHSPSEIVFKTSGKYSGFSSWIGVDAYTSFTNSGSVEFIIEADSKEIYRSGLMTVSDEPIFVDIDIQGVAFLKLIVNDGGNGSHYDHANWGDPKLRVTKP